MTQTTLYQRLGSAGARTGAYNGGETILAFTNASTELRALTSGCGLFDLGWRAKVTVKGRDRIRWLNGMVTNTIKDLPPGHGNYSFVLTPQGRILGDMYVYNRGDYLALDTDQFQLQPHLNTLKRFIIMDQVELADAGESIRALGICGPRAEELLLAAGIDALNLQPLEFREAGNITLVRGSAQRPGWYEIWGSGDREKIWEKLEQAGAQPAGAEALELWRILHGVPKYGQDIRERDLPQETEQMQALNFTKGCYIGQEIVERIRSRGQVHRQFTGFTFPEGLPTPGKFEENGRTIAEITSVADVGERKIGLGYVRRESASAGMQLDLGGTPAVVNDLPFSIG